MRVQLFDLPVDILTHRETLDRILSAVDRGQRCQHVALNVAKLINARSNAELERDIRESDIIGIDGTGILLALRLLGHDVPQRVAGIDLFESLMAECAARGLKPYLLGATPAVLTDAQQALSRRHAKLVFAGSRDGYFKPDEEAGVCDQIRCSGADCLFIAMPTPQKERFMRRHRDALGVPFVMGIGGALDVVAGRVRRAPLALQRAGLEWAYRMAQEPLRLGGRYLYTNAVFAALLAWHLLEHWGRLCRAPIERIQKTPGTGAANSDPQ
jgi:N-acetylglucosaminyldiphosphoundecaprenol N-acetyl-beta-D-mannosaminyltransferase